MREIGRIALIQIQRSSLKVEDEEGRVYYDPAPLLVVESLQLSPAGVVGITADGRRIIDVHHLHHPDSRNSRGVNGVSLGFTAHYASMRQAFGAHLVDGCAGENILVRTETLLRLSDLGQQLLIRSARTGRHLSLGRLKVAAPCVEFSHFAASAGAPMAAGRLKETLQFLNAGRRGFYASVAATGEEMIVAAGDVVFAADPAASLTYSP